MMEKTQAKPLTAAQQRQRDKKRRTWLRAGVQLFFFVSMPGAFVAGFSGVKQLFLHIGAGEVLSADSFTLSLLGLCGFTLLFDRFFCGYACAFGSLGDAVWALSGLVQKKLFHRKKPLRLPERAVLWGQKFKYLLLAGLVALYVTRQEKLLTSASPWEVFSRLTALRLPPEGFGVGIVLFVLILLGMAVQPRFFCQFLCPMGAVFALLPVLPFARLHRQSDGCIPGCMPEAGGKQPTQRGMHCLLSLHGHLPQAKHPPMGYGSVQVPVAAGVGESTAVLPAGLLAGLLSVYLKQKREAAAQYRAAPPFWLRRF